MFLFYVAYGCTFIYTLFVLIYSGRVEVMTTQYKVDKVEAPSVVVCPFWPSTETLVPAGLKDTEILHVRATPDLENDVKRVEILDLFSRFKI